MFTGDCCCCLCFLLDIPLKVLMNSNVTPHIQVNFQSSSHQPHKVTVFLEARMSVLFFCLLVSGVQNKALVTLFTQKQPPLSTAFLPPISRMSILNSSETVGIKRKPRRTKLYFSLTSMLLVFSCKSSDLVMDPRHLVCSHQSISGHCLLFFQMWLTINSAYSHLPTVTSSDQGKL